MRVLVTGATGFIGRTLCEELAGSGYVVRAAVRRECVAPPGVAERAIVGDLCTTSDWQTHLQGVDTVIHLAARVHVLRNRSVNASAYMETNFHATRRLAEEAATAGVRRFIYLSSVKVNGEGSGAHAYTAADEPRPVDAYGESKWRAEKALLEIGNRTGIEATVVRSPLVYGPGVRANFLRLMALIERQWPLPFGAVDNRRSLVSVWNLCDLLLKLVRHPVAPGQVWMVSDAEDLSTAELLQRLGSAMHRRVRLISVPIRLLRLGALLTGREAELIRLCDSLVIDTAETRERLGWEPRVSVNEALALTADWFSAENRSP